ncbi:CatB-related O-acetyltransferase [Roseobacter sinensis]|uniref:CatB-related O-acetyltransferase n=1 Tax=Roseobacter sinensis TaxID=2931391 RepID=A0ABT3BDE5_9RHOB|nr:CatB-related O-acetyltransferase [Roseobacter sp. WL0113]MCV3271601.1 CatB-related O-acetyltransferase [Roseobacter sp. WL0113]
MKFPSPDTVHPVRFPDGTSLPNNVFLKAVIDHPRIEVGDYTYANDFDPPAAPSDWASRLAPYLFPNSRDRLIIGKFGQIAHGVRFITHDANHDMRGISTFPFAIHDPERFSGYTDTLPRGRDTIIGHDVWIGAEARVLPGARLGSGVIIGSGAVVGGEIADYSVVVGNPGRVIRSRFAPEVVERLLQVAWWDWPIENILEHEALIVGADITALEAVAA